VIPLLKTRWLCKKERSRVLLTLEANSDKTGVIFGVQGDVPVVGGNAAQRREYDKRISQGTMSRNGAWCPCCGKPDTVAMTMEDIRQEGLAGRLGVVPTAVVVDGTDSREYRLQTPHERQQAANTATVLSALFDEIPFGLPTEPLPSKEALGFRVPLYGINQWYKLFTDRQLTALATFVKHTRAARASLDAEGYDSLWTEAIVCALAICIDRLADRNSCLAWWQTSAQKVGPTFTRWALPMTWDFCEICPWADASGGYAQAVDWVAEVYEHLTQPAFAHSVADIKMMSATRPVGRDVDVIVTDPPYYDAIPYSDLMDFYYVWLRRTLHGLSAEMDAAFREQLSPKWDYAQNDGELIDDASRFGGDSDKSRQVYEDGMFRAFQACDRALTREGRLVIVFANKQPEAWETLVSAMIRAGFTVDGSWPIQTERVGRMRSVASAALSSSVWLVCKKRPEDVRPGWDNLVLDDMRERIAASLRDFWDAGIRGPDFVWAATGPALEAYSKHPVVKKANDAGKIMEVPEFLRHVRRLVVDFVVGRVLSHNGDMETVSGLDDATTYYLLHRHDFGMEEAPIGPCILYAISCGLSDRELADQYDILVRTGTSQNEEDEESDSGSAEDEATDDAAQGSGSRVKLKAWQQRQRRTLGLDGDSKPAPLVDQVHRLMHLWKAGNVAKVDDYLDTRGLRANHLFHHLLQALIELADHGSEERSLLESISNHVAVRGVAPEKSMKLAYDQVSTIPDEN
jgi:putative DNA methylase